MGVALIIAGVVFRLVAGPTLIRFPLGLDQKLVYQGTATIYVNPATGLPLASPQKVPLTVNREVKVVSGSYSNAVIDETIAMTYAGSTRTEKYQYVMDRRSMKLLNDPQSYAFGNPSNTMAPNNTYRINMPVDVAGSSYAAWVPQSASTTTLTKTGSAHHDPVSDADVYTFNSSTTHPVASYYAKYLAGQGLPTQLSAATVVATLKARGVDVTALISSLAPQLTPAQTAALTAALARPVPLNYSYFQTGQIAAQTTSGGIVNSSASREGISVAPDISAASQAAKALAPLGSLPAVQSLANAVTALATPQPVVSFSYNQTAASAKSAASTANTQARNIDIIRWWLPGALIVIGLLFILGGWLFGRRRRTEVTAIPTPGETPGEPRRRQAG